jgi:hypothetical protein
LNSWIASTDRTAADGVADALPHPALLARGLDGAGAEEEQLQEVAPIERELGHLLLGDRLADRRAAGVEGERARLHFDRLRDRPWIQGEVQSLDLVDGERHIRQDGGLEPRLLGGHQIHANRQERNDVVAIRSGLGLTIQTGLLVGHDDFHAGHHSPARVTHRSRDLSSCGLRKGHPVHEQ